tara:strand:- start:50 stop:280 length:231 start_codon:yes stop_codon:yes gene_type:complete
MVVARFPVRIVTANISTKPSNGGFCHSHRFVNVRRITAVAVAAPGFRSIIVPRRRLAAGPFWNNPAERRGVAGRAL